jgi:hypothetical protein
MGWEIVEWINVAQDRYQLRVVVDSVMNLRVARKAGNFLTNWVTFSFWNLNLLHVYKWFVGLLVSIKGLKSLINFWVWQGISTAVEDPVPYSLFIWGYKKTDGII